MFREYKGSESCVGRCGGRNSNSEILRDNTMADKLMYFPNDDMQNYPFCLNNTKKGRNEKVRKGNGWEKRKRDL